jgi:hypothetical protein
MMTLHKKEVAAATKPMLEINIPWSTMDLLEAQQWYAKLKAELERAGSILNTRLCDTGDAYVCFMAGKPGACPKGVVRTGRPAGIDSAHKDKNGLLKPAKICSERCWILYQKQLIDERREREMATQTS